MLFLVKIWQWLKLFNSVTFIKKTLVNQVYIWHWSFWLTLKVLKWLKTNLKISQFSRFLLRSEYAIEVKNWKWLKLPNFAPFIKKTLLNQVYFRIWSYWLTFIVLQWIKKNSKISQFSSILLRSRSAFYVKIWYRPKVFNSLLFLKKTLVDHAYIWSWSFWLTFTIWQWMKRNSKIGQFSCFLPRSLYAI